MSFKVFTWLMGGLGVLLVVIGGVGYWLSQTPASISLQNAFATPWPAAQPPETKNDQRFTLLVTGDVLTARSVNSKNVQKQDFTWPFQKTADILKAADITFINLETPLTADCQSKIDGMIFCGSLRNTEGLTYAGIDVANLANNHIGNQGEDGVTQTVAALESAGIRTVGVRNPTYMQIQNTKIAFLGYNEVDQQPGLQPVTDERIKAEIAEAQENADLVLVQFHWGAEYQYQPTTNQKRLAHMAIDAGADVILGNHPHWWQPTENYRGKHITYSHGNFVFDQMWSMETREGLVGKYTFEGSNLIDVEFLPVIIEDYGQPRWATPAENVEILSRIEAEKKLLN